MSNSLTLADIRAAADRKYGPTVFTLDDGTEVKLVNPVRLDKDKRNKLKSVGERLKAEDADQVQIMGDIIEMVAEKPTLGRKLVKALDGDAAMLSVVFDAYVTEQQPGEASPSES